MSGFAAAAAIMIPTHPPAPPDRATPSPPAEPAMQADLSVLTYNVRGLPWPVALGRAKALRQIGAELAAQRREGRQPDVVLIQEGFRSEIAELVRASGYRYWVQGPKRGDAARAPPVKVGGAWRSVRYPWRGEGWGKLTGSGLHVLNDLPITHVGAAVFRHCAGFDCLASKGVMLVRLTLPGGQEVEVLNTHLNSRRRAGVPAARTLSAHNMQTDELRRFLVERHDQSRPLLVGGDFNVRNAPERYDYGLAARPYKVVAEFCGQPAATCEDQAAGGANRPWLRSQDLQAFRDAASVQVRPLRVETVIVEAEGKSLSDHDGYLVRYRIAWPVAQPGLHAGPPASTGWVDSAELGQ